MMFRRTVFALALGAMLLGSANGVREAKGPNTYEDYMRQLEPARNGPAFVYLTAEGCGPCRALGKHLKKRVKGSPRYEEWKIVPLELNMYEISDKFPEAGFAEREAALQAVNDVWGVRLQHAYIPKYVVAIDGKATGWGAGVDASGGALTLGFAPVFDAADEGISPFDLGEARSCLMETANTEEYGNATFATEQAYSCIYNSAAGAEQNLKEGRVVTNSGFNKRQLESCLDSADSNGHVTGAAAMRCLLGETIGNNLVPIEYVFKNPEMAVHLSRLPAREFRENIEF